MSTKSADEPVVKSGFTQLTLLNIGIVVSGVGVAWNQALYIGSGEYLIALGLCAMGYAALTLCVAEMSGMVAFAGGCYGFARCALSPLLGFFVGICDLLQSLLYTASMVHVVAKALAIAATSPNSDDYHPMLPLWYFVVYMFLVLMALPGVPILLKCINAASVMTLCLLLIYGLMNTPRWDFQHYAHIEVPFFAGSAMDFFVELITPAHCFIGVNLISLFSEEALDAERTIPRAMLTTLVVMLVFAIWITFTIISVAPGNSWQMIKGSNYPMDYSFETVLQTGNVGGHLLMALLTLSSAMAFFCCARRQLHAMSTSRLIPKFIQKYVHIPLFKGVELSVPIASLIFRSVVGYIALLCKWGLAPDGNDLFELSMIGACCVYLCMFWCFIVFRTRFSSMDRTFSNPLGIPSAVFGIVYFGICLMTIVFVRGKAHLLGGFLPYVFFAMVYYFTVAEKNQFFSPEEQQKFLKAYVLNANRLKKRHANHSIPFWQKAWQKVRLMVIQELDSSMRSQSSLGNSSAHSSGHGSNDGSVRNSQRKSGRMSGTTGTEAMSKSTSPRSAGSSSQSHGHSHSGSHGHGHHSHSHGDKHKHGLSKGDVAVDHSHSRGATQNKHNAVVPMIDVVSETVNEEQPQKKAQVHLLDVVSVEEEELRGAEKV